MKFNFDCFALAQVRPYSEEDESPSVTIHGFFLTRESARNTISALKVDRARAWAAGINSFFGIHHYQEADYDPGRFFIIPITREPFQYVSDLEKAIEAAAITSWRKLEPLATISKAE